MKVYAYEVTARRDGGQCTPQTRVYIPDLGIVAFDSVWAGEEGWRNTNPVFYDTPEAVIAAQRVIRDPKGRGVTYVAEVEVPKETIEGIIAKGRAANTTKREFDAAARTITAIVERSLGGR